MAKPIEGEEERGLFCRAMRHKIKPDWKKEYCTVRVRPCSEKDFELNLGLVYDQAIWYRSRNSIFVSIFALIFVTKQKTIRNKTSKDQSALGVYGINIANKPF